MLLSFRDKRKLELKHTPKLNDGQWHHVTFKNHNQKSTIIIDNIKPKQNSTKSMKLPKRAQLSNILSFGGVPENRSTLPKQISKLEQIEFKGCIRKLSINKTTQDLALPGLHHNIGQCFPRVERGSFFSGDAYAVYSRTFDIGKHLEFKMEFKTSELNGILLSIAGIKLGVPALALEMHNGNIFMSFDSGDGHPYHIKTNLASKFALCDNQWHTISGLYDVEQIAIKIDDEPYITGNSKTPDGVNVFTAAPLYIGGIPGKAFYFELFIHIIITELFVSTTDCKIIFFVLPLICKISEVELHSKYIFRKNLLYTKNTETCRFFQKLL